MTQSINEWLFDTNFALKLAEIHDSEFRRTYKGKRTNEIVYDDGTWFCDEMVKSRNNDKEIKKIIEKGLLESPFVNKEFSKKYFEKVFK